MFSCCSNPGKSLADELSVDQIKLNNDSPSRQSHARSISPEERDRYSIRPRPEGSQPTREEFSSTLKKLFKKADEVIDTDNKNANLETKTNEISPLDVALATLNKYYDGDSKQFEDLVKVLKEEERIGMLSSVRGRNPNQTNTSFDASFIKPLVSSPRKYNYENSDFLKSQLKNIEPLKKSPDSEKEKSSSTPGKNGPSENFLSFAAPLEEENSLPNTQFLQRDNIFDKNKPFFGMNPLPIPQQGPNTQSSGPGNQPMQSPHTIHQLVSNRTYTTQTSAPSNDFPVGSPEWLQNLKEALTKMQQQQNEGNPPGGEELLKGKEETQKEDLAKIDQISAIVEIKEVQTEVQNSFDISKEMNSENREVSPRQNYTNKADHIGISPIKVEHEYEGEGEGKSLIEGGGGQPEVEAELEKQQDGEYFQREHTDDDHSGYRSEEEIAKKVQNSNKKVSVEFTLEEREKKVNPEQIVIEALSPQRMIGPTEANITTPKFNKMYSNENLLEVEHLISSDVRSLIYQQPNMVILEGELMKYKPGLHQNYLKRWCRITSKEFQYFKTRWGANCWDEKPLFSISFSELRAAYRVNMKLPKGAKIDGTNKQQVGKFPLEIFHLEIFPSEIEVPYDEENELLRNVVKKEDVPSIADISRIDKSFTNKSFYTPTKTSVQVLNIKNDHLMPSPAREKLEKPSYSCRKHERKASRDLAVSNFNPSLKASSVVEVFAELNEKATRLNQSNERKSRNSMNLSGLDSRERSPQETGKREKKKIAYTWVKSHQDLSSWTGREKEWYYSEKRLLFASTSEKEREVWLSVLSWLICEYNQS